MAKYYKKGRRNKLEWLEFEGKKETATRKFIKKQLINSKGAVCALCGKPITNMKDFRDNVYVQNALGGVSICVVALILQAVLGLWKKGVKDKLGIVIFAAVFALNMFTDISPIILVVGCGLVGIIAGSLRKGKGEVK